MSPCTWMKLWCSVPYRKSCYRGWGIKTGPIKYLRTCCKRCTILFSPLHADKDLQFHIVKQARAQSAKEGAGYSEGKEQANTDLTSPASCGELLLSPSFVPLRTAVRNFTSFVFNIPSPACLGAWLFSILGATRWETLSLLCSCSYLYYLQDLKNQTTCVTMLDCFKTELRSCIRTMLARLQMRCCPLLLLQAC